MSDDSVNEQTIKQETADDKVVKQTHVQYEDDIITDNSLTEVEGVFSQTAHQVIGPRSSQSALSMQLSDIMRRGSFSFLYPGMDGEIYDFSSERSNANSPIIPSIMHLVKGSLGCGFLCIHEGWKYGGVWSSLILAIVISFLARYSYRMIGFSAQRAYERIRVPKLSYPQLAEAALALGPLHCSSKLCKRARHIMNVWIFFKIMGTLCVYVIMIAKTLKHSLEHLFTKTNMSIRVYIIILVVPLILLSMIRSLRILAILATFADFFVIMCIILAMYQTMVTPEPLGALPAMRDTYGLFKFCAIFSYAIDGSYSILPIENHMKKPRYFYIVTDIGIFITAVFVTAIGFIGYWGWGDKCESPFTIHMPIKKSFMILQLFLAIFFAFSFTIHLFIPFEILWHYASKKFSWARPRGARGLIILQVILIACATIAWPYVIDMLCFLGILCSAWLLFIVPAVIESFVYWEERKRSKSGMALHIINIFYVLFGLILFVGGAVSILSSTWTKESY